MMIWLLPRFTCGLASLRTEERIPVRLFSQHFELVAHDTLVMLLRFDISVLCGAE